MKQQILKGLKKKVLIVERDAKSVYLLDLKELSKTFQLDKMLKLTDAKEEQFAELVERFEGRFENYGPSVGYTSPGSEYNLHTAKESFFSYLEKEGIYFENKSGEKPIPCYDVLWDPEGDYALEQWQKAQEKVWDLSRTYLFEITAVQTPKEKAEERISELEAIIEQCCNQSSRQSHYEAARKCFLSEVNQILKLSGLPQFQIVFWREVKAVIEK